MFGRIKKVIEPGNFSEDSPEMSIGDTVTIRIHERVNHKGQMNPTPGSDWFLIDVDFTVNDVYCSDKMVEKGEVLRMYTDPTLGDYRGGNYIWLDGNQVQPLPTNNISAKHLLTSSE